MPHKRTTNEQKIATRRHDDANTLARVTVPLPWSTNASPTVVDGSPSNRTGVCLVGPGDVSNRLYARRVTKNTSQNADRRSHLEQHLQRTTKRLERFANLLLLPCKRRREHLGDKKQARKMDMRRRRRRTSRLLSTSRNPSQPLIYPTRPPSSPWTTPLLSLCLPCTFEPCHRHSPSIVDGAPSSPPSSSPSRTDVSTYLCLFPSGASWTQRSFP